MVSAIRVGMVLRPLARLSGGASLLALVACSNAVTQGGASGGSESAVGSGGTGTLASGGTAPNPSGTNSTGVGGAPGTQPSGSGGSASAAGGSPVVLPGGTITYYQHLAPIITAKCTGCHQAGSIAPFSLTSYEDAKKWGPTLLPSIDSGAMPPWGQASTAECQPRFGFKNDRRLSAQEKALFHAWVDMGMQAGDPNTAAPLPPMASLDLANANATVKMEATASVSGVNDKFICFPLDPKLAQDVWLTGTQVIAGNKAVVHHVLVFDDPNGESVAKAGSAGQYECLGGAGTSGSSLLSAWAPGATAAEMPPDVGIPVKAGSHLVMQIHYHPTGNGTEMDNNTAVALRWVTTEPKYTGQLALIGNFRGAMPGGSGLLPGPNDSGPNPEFLIPAGVKDHTETQKFVLPGGAQAAALGAKYYVFGAGTHMHYVGRDMKIDVHRPAPTASQPADECLVQTPNWDFNWQGAYFYDAPLLNLPTLSPGDEIGLRCTFDNTLGNPFLPAALDSQGLKAPVDVRLGEATLDEMCLGIFGIAIDSRFAAAAAALK
ncbi:MAG: hypothetical protein SFV15_06140 [Polyangiaceae bacterium]|nr:hypothetical protein [Polyangiaceae bacterium]